MIDNQGCQDFGEIDADGVDDGYIGTDEDQVALPTQNRGRFGSRTVTRNFSNSLSSNKWTYPDFSCLPSLKTGM